MQINKGPDWSATQWLAAAIGFFVSSAVAYVLVWHYGVDRHWAVILVVIGLGGPPFLISRFGSKPGA